MTAPADRPDTGMDGVSFREVRKAARGERTWGGLAEEIRELLAAHDALIASHQDRGRALEWYGEQARLARLIHSEGDAGRNALADDGGKRARALTHTKDADHE